MSQQTHKATGRFTALKHLRKFLTNYHYVNRTKTSVAAHYKKYIFYHINLGKSLNKQTAKNKKSKNKNATTKILREGIFSVVALYYLKCLVFNTKL